MQPLLYPSQGGCQNMRLEQLEYLVLIAKEKSFNSAAENLNISHQALNASLKKLEAEIGVQLIKRTPRGVSFTAAGEKMAAFSREMLQQYRDLLEELRENEQPPCPNLQGKIDVYATSVYMISVMPNIIKNFKVQQKNINIFLHTLSAKNILEEIALAKTNDLVGFVSVPDYEKDVIFGLIEKYKLQFYPFFRSNMCFCASRSSPLADKGKQALKTILKYPIILFASSQDAITFPAECLKEANITLSTSSYNIWLDAVMQDAGLGMLYDLVLLPNSILAKDLDKIAVISTREKIPATMGYITTAMPSKLVLSFIEFFKQSLVFKMPNEL